MMPHCNWGKPGRSVRRLDDDDKPYLWSELNGEQAPKPIAGVEKAVASPMQGTLGEALDHLSGIRAVCEELLAELRAIRRDREGQAPQKRETINARCRDF